MQVVCWLKNQSAFLFKEQMFENMLEISDGMLYNTIIEQTFDINGGLYDC